MKRLLLRLLILLVVIVAILFFARNLIARKSVEVGFAKYTGFPLEIESVNIAPTFGKLEVHNLHLMNPAEFEEETFVKLTDFSIDYQVGSMISGAPHIKDMLLDI